MQLGDCGNQPSVHSLYRAAYIHSHNNNKPQQSNNTYTFISNKTQYVSTLYTYINYYKKSKINLKFVFLIYKS